MDRFKAFVFLTALVAGIIIALMSLGIGFFTILTTVTLKAFLILLAGSALIAGVIILMIIEGVIG